MKSRFLLGNGGGGEGTREVCWEETESAKAGEENHDDEEIDKMKRR